MAGQEPPDAISRTKENFKFADDLGWGFIDADGINGADVFAALRSVVPALGTTERVVRNSTSFGLYNAVTGECFPASGGLHIFVLLKN